MPKGSGLFKQRRIGSQAASADFDLARQWYAQGEFEQAIICLRRVLVAKPNHREALGMREEIEAEYCQSAEYFRAEFRQRPRDPALYRAHANFLHRTHQYAEAIGNYHKGTSINPAFA